MLLGPCPLSRGRSGCSGPCCGVEVSETVWGAGLVQGHRCFCPLRPPGCGQPSGLPQGTHISLRPWYSGPNGGISHPCQGSRPGEERALQCDTCRLHPSGSKGGAAGARPGLGQGDLAAEGKRCSGKGPGLSVPLTRCLWPTCSVTWCSSLPVPEPQSLLRFLRGSENRRGWCPLSTPRVHCPRTAAQKGWRAVPRAVVDEASWGPPR